jgi:regulator of sigma E protease
MSNVFGSIWWLVVTLGLLVTFHEFGHYWVARRFGVTVLRFSIGFGKPLWTRIGKDGTEYCISAIPLGGYVKFLDSREVEIDPSERDGDFTGKPIWQRMLIVVAGPAFNLIFTIAALWAMFVIGKPDYQPIVGRVDAAAATAGFAAGDHIDAIAGEAVTSWTDATLVLLGHALDRSSVEVKVTDASGRPATRQLDLTKIPADKKDLDAWREIGLTPKFAIPTEFFVGKVMKDSAAAAAGLAVDDKLAKVDGASFATWNAFVDAIQGAAGKPITLDIVRDGKPLQLTVTPRPDKDEALRPTGRYPGRIARNR